MIHSTSPCMVLLASLTLLPMLQLLSLLVPLDQLDLLDLLPMLKLLAKLHFLSMFDFLRLSPVSTSSMSTFSMSKSLDTTSPISRLSTVLDISCLNALVSLDGGITNNSGGVTNNNGGNPNNNDLLLFSLVFGLGFGLEFVVMAFSDSVLILAAGIKFILCILCSISRTSSFELHIVTAGVVGSGCFQAFKEKIVSLNKDEWQFSFLMLTV